MLGKRVTGTDDIHLSNIVPGLARRKHSHDVCVLSELREKHIELLGHRLHLDEAGDRGRGMRVLGDGVLERLHDVGEALVPVEVGVHLADIRHEGRDGEEGGTLEENDFFRLGECREDPEEFFDLGEVGNKLVHDAGPGFVEGLVPDGGGEGVDVETLGAISDQLGALVVQAAAVLGLDEVHLVDEDEDVRRGAVFLEGFDDGVVGLEVAVDVARFDVEDIDEDCDVGEDVGALVGEVGFHEGVLPRSHRVSSLSSSREV